MLFEVTDETGNCPRWISDSETLFLLVQFNRIGHESENPNGYCTVTVLPPLPHEELHAPLLWALVGIGNTIMKIETMIRKGIILSL